MKYISLLLITAGWKLINAVCLPTGYCTYTDVSYQIQLEDTYYNISYQYSSEYICDGDDYNAEYYNTSADCTGPSYTIDGGDISG